ncbi:hypothetical protein CVT24_003280 [Panaeolus cyanescens]|uniref:Uncharacterized protein n=1 Tax=Panaeolus cyanescens TaxID=181874 RepID=A0A409YRA1_9AGAR|nr:hypothetical protein CVT24_003280 [Panaeolus cyanescens]
MSSNQSRNSSNAERPCGVAHSLPPKPRSANPPSHASLPQKPMSPRKTAYGQNPYFTAGHRSVPVGRYDNWSATSSSQRVNDSSKSNSIGPIRKPRSQFRGMPYTNIKNDGLNLEAFHEQSLKHHLKVKAHSMDVKQVIQQAVADARKYNQEQSSSSSSSPPPLNTQIPPQAPPNNDGLRNHTFFGHVLNFP